MALTRARHNLIVVGHAPALQQSAPAFAALLARCRGTPGGYCPGGRLPAGSTAGHGTASSRPAAAAPRGGFLAAALQQQQQQPVPRPGSLPPAPTGQQPPPSGPHPTAPAAVNAPPAALTAAVAAAVAPAVASPGPSLYDFGMEDDLLDLPEQAGAPPAGAAATPSSGPSSSHKRQRSAQPPAWQAGSAQRQQPLHPQASAPSSNGPCSSGERSRSLPCSMARTTGAVPGGPSLAQDTAAGQHVVPLAAQGGSGIAVEAPVAAVVAPVAAAEAQAAALRPAGKSSDSEDGWDDGCIVGAQPLKRC